MIVFKNKFLPNVNLNFHLGTVRPLNFYFSKYRQGLGLALFLVNLELLTFSIVDIGMSRGDTQAARTQLGHGSTWYVSQLIMISPINTVSIGSAMDKIL